MSDAADLISISTELHPSAQLLVVSAQSVQNAKEN